MRTLLRLHPVSCFAYFAAVLIITIFTRNPVMLSLSALGAVMLLTLSGKWKSTLLLPLAVFVSAIINAVLVHRGDTILFFVSDYAITLEAFLYGGVFGLMLSAVICWGIGMSDIMTSDKYISVFGNILPVSGLVLSCSLRFVPLFIERAKSFAAVSGEDGIKPALKAYSSAVGYSAEQAMLSADSMRARGYGTAKRTSYSLYRFTLGQGIFLGFVVLLTAVTAVGAALGGGTFEFYPTVSELPLRISDIAMYLSFGILSLIPSAVIIYENTVIR